MSVILVAGAQGLLGASLVPALRASGNHVTGCSRSPLADAQADLANWRQAEALVARLSPDVIVNLAAATDVDECERHPQHAYVTNVRIVENLARAMMNHCPRSHLVQISTDQVYDGPGPHAESDVTLRNVYGFSKYAGELAAASVSSTVLRTNFFGRSGTPSRRSFSDWLVNSLRRGVPVTVFDDVHFSPLSLDRLAALIRVVCERRMAGVFNLGSTQGLSKADFAFAFAKADSLLVSSMARG